MMLKWYEFARKFQEENKLPTYTAALQQATGPWKQYKESFSTEHPEYDKAAVLQWEREEKARKIKSGELPPPKHIQRTRKTAIATVEPTPPQQHYAPHTSKRGEEEEEDEDYDVFIKETITKKRKRNHGSSSSSGGGGLGAGGAATAPPPPKKKRTRRTPAEMKLAREAAAEKKKEKEEKEEKEEEKDDKGKGKEEKLSDTHYEEEESNLDGEFLQEMEEQFNEEDGEEVTSAQPMNISRVTKYAEDFFG